MENKESYMNKMVLYIKKNLKKGYTRESLHWALVNQGHSKLEIERAFKKADEEIGRKAPVLKTKPQITYHVYDHKDEPKQVDVRKKKFWKRIFD